jgi:CMP-N-acetylneuraminic acid synthetase
MYKIAALIPAKKFSKRLANKNFKVLNRYSLVERKIKQLKESKLITDIYVGSNELVNIPQLCNKYKINFVERSELACNEEISPANHMIKDFVSKIKECDIVMWVHLTNPFIYSVDYDKAIKVFIKNYKKKYDSLMSVDSIKNHMWNNKNKPVNYDPYLPKHTLANDLEPVFFQNGAIFIQKYKDILKNNYFFGKNPFLYPIDTTYRSIDINNNEDFQIAKQTVKYYDKKFKFF